MAAIQPSGHLADLIATQCAVPYEYLGLHAGQEGSGLVIRVWQPDVMSLTVADLLTGTDIGVMSRLGNTDLFELPMPRRSKRFPYKLRGRWRICRHSDS